MFLARQALGGFLQDTYSGYLSKIHAEAPAGSVPASIHLSAVRRFASLDKSVYAGRVKTRKEKLAEAQFDSIGAMMSAYAAEAVRVAAAEHRIRLDFSLESIPSLENLLAGQAAADLEYQSKTWGSYFGEVLRKRWGGEWSLTQYPNAVAAVPTLEVNGSRLYPLMKVYRRLTLGESEDLVEFLGMVAKRLDTAPIVH